MREFVIDVDVVTPTDKTYVVKVEGKIVRFLIGVFDEIPDIPCQAWIYPRLEKQIVKSAPHYIGAYLGYTWRKHYEPSTL